MKKIRSFLEQTISPEEHYREELYFIICPGSSSVWNRDERSKAEDPCHSIQCFLERETSTKGAARLLNEGRTPDPVNEIGPSINSGGKRSVLWPPSKPPIVNTALFLSLFSCNVISDRYCRGKPLQSALCRRTVEPDSSILLFNAFFATFSLEIRAPFRIILLFEFHFNRF